MLLGVRIPVMPPRMAAALAAMLLIIGCAAPQPLPSAVADPSPPSTVSPPPRILPASAAPTESSDGELGAELPRPACPGPGVEVLPPTLFVQVADLEPHTPPLAGSQIATCSTTRVSDSAGVDPPLSIPVLRGDVVRYHLEGDWRPLQWEASGRTRGQDDITVIPGETLDSWPAVISVPVPDQTGDVLLGITIWAMRNDERALATVSTLVWLRISDPSVIALGRTPADLGCDSVGWPEDLEAFQNLTFTIDPEAAEQVGARSDTGRELLTYWPADFEAGSTSQRVVRDPTGAVVVRDGDVLDLPTTGSLEIHGHPVCLRPSVLYVMADAPPG
jgi:hypothetical protein